MAAFREHLRADWPGGGGGRWSTKRGRQACIRYSCQLRANTGWAACGSQNIGRHPRRPQRVALRPLVKVRACKIFFEFTKSFGRNLTLPNDCSSKSSDSSEVQQCKRVARTSGQLDCRAVAQHTVRESLLSGSSPAKKRSGTEALTRRVPPSPVRYTSQTPPNRLRPTRRPREHHHRRRRMRRAPQLASLFPAASSNGCGAGNIFGQEHTQTGN